MTSPYYDYYQLERNRMGTASPGWSHLGAALMGGGAKQEQSFQTGALNGARMQNAMAEARMNTFKANAQQNLGAALHAQGIDPQQAEIVAALMGAGHDPHQFGEYQNDQQKLTASQGALQAAQGGDDTLMNRLIAAGSMHPLEVTKIQGDTVLNPYQPQDGQPLNPTQVGMARIGTQHAEAGKFSADAGAANALAAQRTAKTPGAPQASEQTLQGIMNQANAMAQSGAKDSDVDAFVHQQMLQKGLQPNGEQFYGNEKPTALTTEEIKANFGDGQGGIDQDSLRRFYNFQRSKNLPNSTRALQQFGTDFSNVQGGAVPPEQPGLLQRMFGGGSPAPQPGPDPADGADITYDPQNRGLPNSSNDLDLVKRMAGARDANISAFDARAQGKKVVRTGTAPDGTRVVQYDDGTIAPAS